MNKKIQKLFSPKNFLVIGDVMLDVYEYGVVERISPEAPVPIFFSEKISYTLGGAGNVANNLKAAEQNVSLIALIGDDTEGERLLSIAENKKIVPNFLIEKGFKTIVKKRLIAENNQHVLRVDYENRDIETASFYEEKLLALVEDCMEGMDAILIADYNKNMISEIAMQGILSLAKEKGIPTFVDSKKKNPTLFKNAFLLKPNRKEFKENFGFTIKNLDAETLEKIDALRKKIQVENLVLTLGPDGIVLSHANGCFHHPTRAKKIFDVSGAGDTVLSWLALSVVHGFSMEEAVDIANYAAGVAVSKPGTAVVYPYEIRDAIHPKEHKIMSLEEIKERIAALREEKKTIVFTNGCFDILHRGHIEYLKKASELGDYFIIGLNSDDSVRRLKGKDRPINKQEDRAMLLSHLYFCDAVVFFEEDTPINLIKEIKPDVLVKGGDYKDKEIVGADFVKSYQGRVEIIDFVEGYSTTQIINSLKK